MSALRFRQKKKCFLCLAVVDVDPHVAQSKGTQRVLEAEEAVEGGRPLISSEFAHQLSMAFVRFSMFMEQSEQRKQIFISLGFWMIKHGSMVSIGFYR